MHFKQLSTAYYQLMTEYILGKVPDNFSSVLCEYHRPLRARGRVQTPNNPVNLPYPQKVVLWTPAAETMPPSFCSDAPPPYVLLDMCLGVDVGG